MTQTKVYLVDDHPIVSEGLRRLLDLDSEIEVIGVAANAEEALDQLQFSSPEVVLMDIRLPGMNGIEATRQIKVRHPHIRVVILSAFGNEYLAQAIEAGADGYVLKTSKQSELVDAVKHVANGHYPIDSGLTSNLMSQFAEMYKRSGPRALTTRQLAILGQVAGGVSSKQIAKDLSISDATFKRDLRGVFDYFGVNDRAQAIAEAYKRKLL